MTSTKGTRILCTLGPASLNKHVIERLTERGVDFFRINMSHTSLENLEQAIRTIRQFSAVPICVDTEGAQVRTGPMPEGTVLKDRQRVILKPGRAVGSADCVSLWPESAFDTLQPGHLIAVDFDAALLMVVGMHDHGVEAIAINGGQIGSNKAVTCYPSPALPALSEKDKGAIEIALRHRIDNFALSFANTAADVAKLRELVGPDANIISKIESRKGVTNLDSILEQTDAILIDRGDLSRDVPLENIPLLQKAIIRKANAANRPAYVATNLLESMMTNSKPTRAELNDVLNTLVDGANGLVLAAETAIGKQPVAAVDMLATVIEHYRRSLDGFRIEDLLVNASPLLPKLHGQADDVGSSKFVAARTNSTQSLVSKLKTIDVNVETALDVDQISDKVYSPLTGFMNQDELESVLDHYRLPSGAVWTLPIVFQVSRNIATEVQLGMTVALRNESTGEVIGTLQIEDKFSPDLVDVAERWFGTSDRKHPGVERLFTSGEVFLGGTVQAVDNKSESASTYRLTPEQSRMIFTMKGWSRVVAFHTRNVPHRGHEFVMMEAVRRVNADGLFIHPVVGPKKAGDFTPEAIMGAYDIFIEQSCPGALLGAFATYSRYSGPREAVFTALCRKNYGCTHFIVGRDHTGVGDFYKSTSAQSLFETVGDIGIKIVPFDRVNYCPSTESYVECNEPDNDKVAVISGTFVRDSLRSGQAIPDWCMRESIAHWLGEQISAGEPVFVDHAA